MVSELINIEVAYADETHQMIIPLQVSLGCTAQQAIEQSDILQQVSTLDLQVNKIGIFGKLISLDAVLQSGDRVEIYQPLLIDPKQARQQRAVQQKKTIRSV